MDKVLVIIFSIFLTTPAFSAIESKATIDHTNWKGYGITQYGTRDDNEYSSKEYRYSKSTKGSKEFYLREAALLSRPCI